MTIIFLFVFITAYCLSDANPLPLCPWSIRLISGLVTCKFVLKKSITSILFYETIKYTYASILTCELKKKKSVIYVIWWMTWALSLSGICLFQRSLSSLELPRVVSVANGTSSISASSVPSIEDSDKINGDNHVGSLRLSEYSGKQRQKSHDPRDLSIQVLEKFSLVTKFARETTSHLFRENYSDSFNAYDTKQQVPPLPANAPDKGPGDTEKDLTEAPVASDPLEVSLDLYIFLSCKCNSFG